jgi:hypothetical protein
MEKNRITVPNSTYPKGGFSCSKDSFVVNQSLFSASTFVVKIATFAKPETVMHKVCKTDNHKNGRL